MLWHVTCSNMISKKRLLFKAILFSCSARASCGRATSRPSPGWGARSCPRTLTAGACSAMTGSRGTVMTDDTRLCDDDVTSSGWVLLCVDPHHYPPVAQDWPERGLCVRLRLRLHPGELQEGGGVPHPRQSQAAPRQVRYPTMLSPG